MLLKVRKPLRRSELNCRMKPHMTANARWGIPRSKIPVWFPRSSEFAPIATDMIVPARSSACRPGGRFFPAKIPGLRRCGRDGAFSSVLAADARNFHRNPRLSSNCD